MSGVATLGGAAGWSGSAGSLLASIPSPSWNEWHIAGPFAIRAYALCIIAGVIAAIVIGNRRWVARGGQAGVVVDLVLWAVPLGIIGARIYHVITDYQLYFGPGKDPWQAFAIWDGGLGIWGAIVLGGVGVWAACRRRGIPMPAMADALAPGIAIAQALGRWGNWFNQELFGKPSTLPWALEIDPVNRPSGYEQFDTFHPTFLYESLWCIAVALFVIWADRRFRMGHGRAFALYVAAYTVGRTGMEYLRIDEVNHIFGMRLNFWTSLIVFLGAVTYIVISARRRPGREEIIGPIAKGAHADTGDIRGASADESDSGDDADSADELDSGDDADSADELDSGDDPDPDDARSEATASERSDDDAAATERVEEIGNSSNSR